nr:MAG: capsid protein [Cressdnaviricota sp.]
MPKHVTSRSRSNARGRSTTRRPVKRTRAQKTKSKSVSKRGSSKKTFKKSGSLNNTAQQVGNAHWLSFGKTMCSKGSHFLRKLEKVLTPSFYTTNNTFQIQPSSGLQAIEVEVVYHDTALQQIAVNTWDVQFQAGAAGSTGYAGPAIGTNSAAANTSYYGLANSKILLISVTETYRITNTSNSNVFIDIYDIVARRDIGLNPTGVGNAAMSPTQAWAQGDIVESATMAGNGTNWTTVIGSTPFQSRMFTQLYKITRKTRLNLTNGESAEHVKKTRPNRIWDLMLDNIAVNTTNTAGSGIVYPRMLSQFTMFVVSGAPGSTTGGSVVTTTNPIIDVIHTAQYKSAMISSSHTWLGVNNTVSTTGVTNLTAFGAGTTEALENAH